MTQTVREANMENDVKDEKSIDVSGNKLHTPTSENAGTPQKAVVRSLPVKKGNNFKYTGKRRIKRHIVPPNIPKSERVHTPIEAQKMRQMTIERIGYVSQSKKLQQQRIRSLKARRTLTLVPAPLPPTAPKNRFAMETHKIVNTVLKHLSRIDYIFLASVVALAVIGIFAVHSATNWRNSIRYDIMEIGCFMFGMCSLIVFSMFDYSSVKRYTKHIIALNVILSLYTVIFGYSILGDSNRNWISIFGIGIQPAEFSKVLFILSMASHLHRLKDNVSSLKSVVTLGIHGILCIGLVLAQGDLGNSTVFMVVFVVMCFAARMNIWYFVGALGAAVCISPIIWQNLADYQRQRILIGFNPDLDPLDKGFQAIRTRNALASGGIFGKGYGEGYVTQNGRLFAIESDMIFGSIGEEMGLIACVAVIALYVIIIYRCIRIAMTAKDLMGSYICVGVAAMFAYQFIMSVGMCMGNLPVVGITLPVVSYGGSSLLSSYIALTLVLSVHTNSNKYSYML